MACHKEITCCGECPMYMYDDHWMGSVCQAKPELRFYDGSDLKRGMSKLNKEGGWDYIENMIHVGCPIISNSPYMIHLRPGGVLYEGPPEEGI